MLKSNSNSATGTLSNHWTNHSPYLPFPVLSICNPLNFQVLVLTTGIAVQNIHFHTDFSTKMYLSFLIEYCKRDYCVTERSLFLKFKMEFLHVVFFMVAFYLWFKTEVVLFGLIFPPSGVQCCSQENSPYLYWTVGNRIICTSNSRKESYMIYV